MTDRSNRHFPPDILPRFASVVAHELRNPLSAVKIALQTLARQGALSPKDSSRVEIALREVGTIEQLLSQLLDWVRPTHVQASETSAGSIAKQAVVMCRSKFEEAKVAVRIAGAETSRLWVDQHLVSRALSELLLNAAQASSPGGEVVLTIRDGAESGSQGIDREIDREIDPNDLQDPIAFEIRDNGVGIPGEDAEELFDPFFSRRARGFGLGLPRAREIARLHQGDITLQAMPGGGTLAVLEIRRQGPGLSHQEDSSPRGKSRSTSPPQAASTFIPPSAPAPLPASASDVTPNTTGNAFGDSTISAAVNMSVSTQGKRQRRIRGASES